MNIYVIKYYYTHVLICLPMHAAIFSVTTVISFSLCDMAVDTRPA